MDKFYLTFFFIAREGPKFYAPGPIWLSAALYIANWRHIYIYFEGLFLHAISYFESFTLQLYQVSFGLFAILQPKIIVRSCIMFIDIS